MYEPKVCYNSAPPHTKFSFLLNVLQRRFSQKDQSLCHHQIPQILLSWLPLSSPQLGQQWWRGQDLLLVQHQLLGQAHQPYVADEAPDVDIGQSLCKQAWLERFNIYTSCFHEGIDLILRHLHQSPSSLCRIRAVGADRGHGVGESWASAAGRGANCWRKWGPDPNTALPLPPTPKAQRLSSSWGKPITVLTGYKMAAHLFTYIFTQNNLAFWA